MCHYRAMIQEASDVEKIGMKHYSFVPGTMELVNVVVTFNTQDLAWITVSHEDALVLSLKIARFQVCRVLVDPGSSVDLLCILAYKQMGIWISTLGNPGRVLKGFNGSTTWILGEIIFPIKADLIALNVLFSVVSNPSPYNSILRWMDSQNEGYPLNLSLES